MKRTADRVVAHSKDISDLINFMEFVIPNITNVIMSIVTETLMDSIDKLLSELENIIPETFKIHQITWDTMNPKEFI